MKVTIEQWMTELLVSKGMSEKDAVKIIRLVKDDPLNEVLKDRWSDDASDYPSD